jgi:EAL domain-containing protein (putative c-di-GMP-specific phosphodiesterase class I)
LARLGGDEFGALLEHCRLEDALRLAENLRRSVQDFRFAWQGTHFKLGISIGLVSLKEGGYTFEQVLCAADTACFAAKDNGRNRVHVYESDDRAMAQRRGDMKWIPRVQEALSKDQFRLYYQAIVPVSKTDASDPWGEILLRLLDETGNVILPGAFLPAIERYGQMDAVDRWVVSKALTALGTQIGMVPQARLSVNVSGQSLHSEDLLGFVIEQIDQAGIRPELIGFEITETAAIANLDAAQNFISTLKARGCRIALDDFGSGLSSFTYLRTLPVDYLKIDASFIRTMCRDPIDRAMVEGIHQISQVMGLKTIAEGVEDGATLEALRALGVNYAQGAGIALPRALELNDGEER